MKNVSAFVLWWSRANLSIILWSYQANFSSLASSYTRILHHQGSKLRKPYRGTGRYPYASCQSWRMRNWHTPCDLLGCTWHCHQRQRSTNIHKPNLCFVAYGDMPTNKARKSINAQQQSASNAVRIFYFLIFQTSKWYYFDSVWACVSHAAACHDNHQVGFAQRHLLFCLVMLQNESFYFKITLKSAE